MHVCEIHAYNYEMHACEMHTCKRCTPVKCTSVRDVCMPMKCTPVRDTEYTCQRKYHFRIFRIRLDPHGCATLVPGRIFVYTSSPPPLGVAVAIAAETPWERRGW